jgi:hypothetical protein
MLLPLLLFLLLLCALVRESAEELMRLSQDRDKGVNVVGIAVD